MVHLSSLTSWLPHPLTTRWRMPSADARIFFASFALILLNLLRPWRKLGTGGANSWTTSLLPSSGYLPRPPAVAFTTGSSFRRPVPGSLPLGPGLHTCSPFSPLIGRRSSGPSLAKGPGHGRCPRRPRWPRSTTRKALLCRPLRTLSSGPGRSSASTAASWPMHLLTLG